MAYNEQNVARLPSLPSNSASQPARHPSPINEQSWPQHVRSFAAVDLGCAASWYPSHINEQSWRKVALT